MPEAFRKCVAAGGRVRTIKPSPDKFMPICFDSNGSHAGEVKTKKSSKKSKRSRIREVVK